MCGISGIMYKKSRSQGVAPIGQDLIEMLESLTHRGKDSSGVTVAGEHLEEDLIIRIWTDDAARVSDVVTRCEEVLLSAGGVVRSKRSWGEFLRLSVNYEGEIPALAESLVNIEGIELHSIGEDSEVVKDVGTPAAMNQKHEISLLRGTHGIGHVRMATESRVDIKPLSSLLGLSLPGRYRRAQWPAYQLPQAEAHV